MNPLLERFERADNGLSPAHKRSRAQEEALAKRIKGRRTPGSGCGRFHKGDVVNRGVIRIECKTTGKKSFAITREMIAKIRDAALSRDEIPAIVIEFIDETGKPEHEIALVPVAVLELLL